jgi:hypothetical protein
MYTQLSTFKGIDNAQKPSFRTDFACKIVIRNPVFTIRQDCKTVMLKCLWHFIFVFIMAYAMIKHWIPHLRNTPSACAVRYDGVPEF